MRICLFVSKSLSGWTGKLTLYCTKLFHRTRSSSSVFTLTPLNIKIWRLYSKFWWSLDQSCSSWSNLTETADDATRCSESHQSLGDLESQLITVSWPDSWCLKSADWRATWLLRDFLQSVRSVSPDWKSDGVYFIFCFFP